MWRHPANQQQLLHRLQRFVEGSIGIGQLAVVIAFGTKLPWLLIFIDPIEDGIGDLFGHPWESHQQLSSDVGQRTKGIGCGAEFGGDSHRREVGTPGHLLQAAKLLVDDHECIEIQSSRFVLETETEPGIAPHFVQVGGDDRIVADLFDVRVGNDIDRLKVVWIIPKASSFFSHLARAREEKAYGIESRVGGHAGLKLPAGQDRLFVAQHHRLTERKGR